MFGINTKAANGTEGGPRYVERVARLLSEDLNLAPEPLLAPLNKEAGQKRGAEQAGEPWEPWIEAPACSDCDTLSPGREGAVEDAARPQVVESVSLEEGTRRIAEALWRLTQDPVPAREREAERDRKLAAAGEAIDRVSGELHGLSIDLAGVRAELAAGSQRESEVRGAVSSLEDRWRQSESGLKTTQDQMGEFQSEAKEQARNLKIAIESLESRLSGLNEAIDRLEQSLRTQSEATCTLSSQCEGLRLAQTSLEERQNEQALVIDQLEADNSRTGSLIDTVAASLRGLDGRAERRRGVEKEIRVAMIGETETSIPGHIVDASETGLGLRLSAAVPVGSRLQLEIDGALFVGEVAHCKRRGEWYTAGLKATRRLEVHAS